MKNVSPVFKQTYQHYIAEIAKKDLSTVGDKLGVRVRGREIIIDLFGVPYTVSEDAVRDPSGKRPPFEKCIILCKYILMCPENPRHETEWISYRDFRDSGPLTKYFAHDVEQALSNRFSGKREEMKKACMALGGYPPNVELSYDIAVKFDMLPKVPLLLLFNDADNEFPAHCSVLFQKGADEYLDAECLAVAGRLLYSLLI
jgi:hypothetical protein